MSPSAVHGILLMAAALGFYATFAMLDPQAEAFPKVQGQSTCLKLGSWDLCLHPWDLAVRGSHLLLAGSLLARSLHLLFGSGVTDWVGAGAAVPLALLANVKAANLARQFRGRWWRALMFWLDHCKPEDPPPPVVQEALGETSVDTMVYEITTKPREHL